MLAIFVRANGDGFVKIYESLAMADFYEGA